MRKYSALSMAAALSLPSGAGWAAEGSEPLVLEPMQIIGDKATAKTLPGSGYVVGEEQMATEVVDDIHQVLKTVPGVYVREEEGFGLRPTLAGCECPVITRHLRATMSGAKGGPGTHKKMTNGATRGRSR